MSDQPPGTAPCTEVWIAHPEGRLFSRVWTPDPPTGRPLPDAPIIMLHDSLGSVELWRDFPAALSLATGRRVVAYDRLGFGLSSPRHGPLPLDFIAAEARHDFALVRQQLGIGPFIAFGHSVGGGMAVNCAAEFADDCEALITIAAQAFPEDRTLDGIRVAKAQFKDVRQVERLGKYHGDKARWVLDAWTETWLSPAFATWSLAPVLPRVSCPLLVIHGLHDEYGSTRHPELIGQLSRSRRVQVEIMEDSRHMPHREHPEAVIERVKGFLEGG
ncbi:alpha/beta fold hydrolase [Zoogloea sp.]|uniref:alpha/beta fold hydrolase n=1 Tax=Zoogloea sp. TaxID=49181 RepID=UPI001B438FCA|nr:alpha/beta fold hydrolase [Zoogloea sp.]MBK6653949.1 alpha/beta fold hydrolase [Zoogloea sp.]MBK7847376.1 alpha/beta fold hydrolase [Zoogloea sp.]MBP7445693.1 alpha/beta fold hydrolase [Zoogloea sp.]